VKVFQRKVNRKFKKSVNPEERLVKLYLDRINISHENGIPVPSVNLLQTLQNAHMQAIPFENLSIMYKEYMSKKAISLKFKDLYQKVVLNKRGGFCFELNALFSWLLEKLGFKVYCLPARVVIDENYNPPYGIIDHMTLLVELDESYLVDVGFGDSFRNPIRMLTESVERYGLTRRYRITKIDDFHVDPLNHLSYKFSYERFNSDLKVWERQFEFSDQHLTVSDFTDSCEWMETSETSGFTKRVVISRATTDGRITLSNKTFTTTDIKGSRKQSLKKEGFSKLLYNHFGILESEIYN
jgi:N-hydroxyarylamine O-acetyltransferase